MGTVGKLLLLLSGLIAGSKKSLVSATSMGYRKRLGSVDQILEEISIEMEFREVGLRAVEWQGLGLLPC
ncbi:MAG: hypothetical protein AAGD22_04620 [Verrucomicrobiota bacterium]